MISAYFSIFFRCFVAGANCTRRSAAVASEVERPACSSTSRMICDGFLTKPEKDTMSSWEGLKN